MSADPPAVTAVVPTHERPELMRRAVQSILDQTYPGDVEVIVVFDACEPELPAVELGDHRRLRGVVNERTPGLAGARNTGILAATHELIAFLDDDDHWAPTKLAEQIVLRGAHPTAPLVGTASLVHDGTRTHERLLPSPTVSHGDLLQNRLAGLHSSSFLVFRSALLGDLGLIDEDLPRSYCEDWDLLLRASAITPIPVVNRPLVNVTWQGQSHFVGRWAEYADALQHLLRKHPDLRRSRRGLARLEAQIAFALSASGDRAAGTQWAVRSLRRAPAQAKPWLALAVASRLTSADRIARGLRRFGRGV